MIAADHPDTPPLTIVALLPARLLRHLQSVASANHRIVPVRSHRELMEYVAEHAVSAAIIDPSIDGSVQSIEELAAAYPSLSLIGYVPLTPAGFRGVAATRKDILDEVILYAHDDAVDPFRATLERVTASPLTSRMLDALEPKLNVLPTVLSQSVVTMFREPHRYISAHDLAVTCELQTSRLYRCFEVAKLAPPKKVLIAAKLLRGYVYLGDPGHTVRGVARKLGYRKARIFSDQSREVFGHHASRVVLHLDDNTALERLVAWCGV